MLKYNLGLKLHKNLYPWPWGTICLFKQAVTINHFDRCYLRNEGYLQPLGARHKLSVNCRKGCSGQRIKQLLLTLTYFLGVAREENGGQATLHQEI